VRFLDIRELVELILGTLLGLGVVWFLDRQWPGLLRDNFIAPRQWYGIGAGVGLLLAAAWSARKVDQRIDHRVPPHQRPSPSFRDGRPVGVLAWRTRDATSEYLWLVMGVVVVLVIIWLARRFVPQMF
jgi:hypothetical protein